MAPHSDDPKATATGTARTLRSHNRHSLLTPDGTPAPEEARMAADQKRSAEGGGQQAPMSPIVETPNPEGAQTKPTFEIGSQDDREAHSDTDDNAGEVPPPTDAQVEAVGYVESRAADDDRGLLKLGPATEDARQDKEDVTNALIRVGCLTHPDFNKTKGASKAFKRVLAAGKRLRVDKDDINEVKFWDGEEIEERHLTPDGNWVEKADAMQGVEKLPAPTETHRQLWHEATPLLGRLMKNPLDEDAVANLKDINARIVETNTTNGFPEAMVQSYTVGIDTFKATFMEASPLVDRLRRNMSDTEARSKFDALNDRLKDLNRLCQYPEEWVMEPPTTAVAGPVVHENGRQSKESSSSSVQAGVKPGYRKCKRQDGYVREDGIDKKIEGSLKVGFGYQILVSHPGKNNLTIYEKVAAATFGKGFGQAYHSRPDAKTITMGNAGDLQNKNFEDMAIGGVASDRRDPGKMPEGGWAREAKTIVLVSFGDSPSDFVWYTRSTLGQRFGPTLVDEEINGYRIDADQIAPLPPTRTSKSHKTSVIGSPTIQKTPGQNEVTDRRVEDPMVALLAKLKNLEAQIKRVSNRG